MVIARFELVMLVIDLRQVNELEMSMLSRGSYTIERAITPFYYLLILY